MFCFVYYSGKDKEESWKCEVQGAMHTLPVHPGHHRQGEGRETQAESAPRWANTLVWEFEMPPQCHKMQLIWDLIVGSLILSTKSQNIDTVENMLIILIEKVIY